MSKNKAVKKPDSSELKAHAQSRWAEIFLLNLMAVFPLFMFDKYIFLTRYKAYYLWLTSLVLFAALLLINLAFLGLAKRRSPLERVSSMKIPDWAALGYLLFVAMSAAFTPLPAYFNGESNFWFFLVGAYERHDGILTIAAYVLMYFAVSRFYTEREHDWTLFAVSAVIVSMLGILQRIGFDIFEIYPYGYSDQTVGIYPYNHLDIIFQTTLGNVDIVSPFVCIVIGFFITLYMKSDKKIRFVYLAAVVTTFAMMIAGGADGGKVGVIAMLALLFAANLTDKRAISRMFLALSLSCLLTTVNTAAFAARDHYNATGEQLNLYFGGFFKDIWFLGAVALFILAVAVRYIPVWLKATPWKAAVITVALALVIGVAGIEVVGARVENPENIIYQARETMHLRFADEFGSWRGFIWNHAIQVVPDNLLFGTGPDTFEWAFYEYQQLALDVTGITYDKAHNDYLQILVCNGLLGLAAFLVLLFGLGGKAVGKMWDSPIIMACAMACAAYMVQAFFGISTPIMTPLFFVLLGLVRGKVYAS